MVVLHSNITSWLLQRHHVVALVRLMDVFHRDKQNESHGARSPLKTLLSTTGVISCHNCVITIPLWHLGIAPDNRDHKWTDSSKSRTALPALVCYRFLSHEVRAWPWLGLPHLYVQSNRHFHCCFQNRPTKVSCIREGHFQGEGSTFSQHQSSSERV